ncbi:hypothetical protein SAMN02745673_04305 [Marinactinospora thermotolerans DSM 45154]|uniref:Uncharacterized protein n=1 Tax=Marinactinospora thermotolerans DSM 45154 TaxID=1122192 RepID=A0A1T4T224_9ACTN|nr:hypothetical protein [Marinactinospora thermotolerans]SKA34493.1 hypothetical protein SAMN02745673_04305 [Marinactinospora thermotolerans DSM 45154]
MLRELSSAPLTAWGNAWLSGRVGLDDAVDAVERNTGPHVVGALPDGDPLITAGTPLRAALAGLRPRGLSAFRLCLPVPGDPLGLVGPAELNKAAIEAREAVLVRLGDRQVGLVPGEDRRGSSYVGVLWTPYPAVDSMPEPLPLADAEHRLTLAVRESTDLFGRIDDIAPWGPEVVRALSALRDAERSPTPGLPPGHPPRAHRVAALADRLAVVVHLAGEDPGRGLDTAQMRARREALRLLDGAVRRARVAAYCSAVGG